MKIKRVKYNYHYYHDGKVLTWLLLTRYNPVFISTKIRAKEMFIEDLYYLNQSHINYCDIRGVVPVAFPVDKLVLLIIREKEKLEYYKSKSTDNINHLKRVMSRYTPYEQKQLMHYLSSNGSYVPEKVIIEKLQRDLYQVVNPIKQSKIKQFKSQSMHVIGKHVKEVKEALNTELEVLTI
ncbi:pathogenicity island protein [Macrococcoides goetzii]|uniref:pathogenicity island protein n=1 Tax=Macrococcoides goetzii TaxID=1891097 RepID=UPI000C420C92|nr:pathogenicity island protein [Macrococcus goetzii]